MDNYHDKDETIERDWKEIVNSLSNEQKHLLIELALELCQSQRNEKQ